ncbi:MAG: amino acid permease [Candidatus Aenigmarchaeota archaeon]|nr:amino acid permease [Candidatus Aenigmarchaeota archaeon]
MSRKFRLKKELGLRDTTLYGIGIILGAGIYALLGSGAAITGNSIWLSFVLAAFIATLTGLSYAELSSMYPKEAAEYNYTKNAFRKRGLAFIIGWILIVSAILSASTVALGFAGYFSHLFGGNILVISAVLLVILSIMNYRGIKESARFNSISTVIEAAGLVIIIAAGIWFFGRAGPVDFFEMNNGIFGIISATALIFFAYIGFEDVANISEETKNARKVVPKALVLSILISTVLYIAVSVAAVSIAGSERLASSNAPLTEVMSSVLPEAGVIMSIIALFATSNTVLILLVVASRMMYGISCQRDLPRRFSRICKRGTPVYSVMVTGIVALLGLLIGGIETVALFTTVGIFIAYFFVNASLIHLRYTKPKAKRPFKVPLNIGKFPAVSALGAVTCAAMLLYFDVQILLMEAAVIAAGVLLYKAMRR